MAINPDKTKVMVFGAKDDEVCIKVKDTVLENVKSYKYLGVILDQQLDFTMHVDYSVSKAKRAGAKVSSLIVGRNGLPVQIGIELYKSLVRPHLEYAIPAWANISDKDLDKLEAAQVQCLKRVLGAKAHSSSAAVEVISGIMPVRFRKRELCCREYMRIITKENGHEIINLLASSTRVGLKFCPLEYIKVMSKELDRAISGSNLVKPEIAFFGNQLVTASDCFSVLGTDSITINTGSTNDDAKVVDVGRLIVECQGKNIVIFTDGSVCEGSVGSGACAAVLFSKSDDGDVWIQTAAVGTRVSAFECEVEGVGLGIRMAIHTKVAVT